jgi:outer membrane protein assembly factor BamD (BamD/ComL family)
LAISRAVVVVAVVMALALGAGCSRNKDPYDVWKPPQMLDEGERLLRNNDLAAAEAVFRKGFVKAQKADYPPDKTRVFLVRLLYVAAARNDVAGMQKQFVALKMDADPRAMDPRLALHLVLLLHKAGKDEEARKLAEKLALRLAARPPENNFDERAYYTIGWIVIDRLRTANVEIERAKEASDAVMKSLEDMAQYARQSGIRPGLRRWITAYVDHLFDNDRARVAEKVSDMVERIDQMAPPTDDTSLCVALDSLFPSLGCLAEFKP